MKKAAVFFDRDGTLIEYHEVLRDTVDVALLPHAGEAVAAFKQKGYLVIGVTNQPSLEKGMMTQKELDSVHATLQEKLRADGGALDAIYTCPHQYRAERQCACRKPGLGLIEKAEADFSIDRRASYMVGDRLRDIETGKRAGMKTILISLETPSKDDELFPDTKPDATVTSLLEAVCVITDNL
ncbi:MAG TPA: HAD-IIIA family hydrolase [Candidatus Paceibacterota bacterium]